MSDRVAIGTSDGEWIDQHFGSCEQFYIYDVSDVNEWSFVEVRVNGAPDSPGQHQESRLQKTMEHLSDCSKVLVSRIGPGPNQMLKDAGITAYTLFISVKHAQEKLNQSS